MHIYKKKISVTYIRKSIPEAFQGVLFQLTFQLRVISAHVFRKIPFSMPSRALSCATFHFLRVLTNISWMFFQAAHPHSSSFHLGTLQILPDTVNQRFCGQPHGNISKGRFVVLCLFEGQRQMGLLGRGPHSQPPLHSQPV